MNKIDSVEFRRTVDDIVKDGIAPSVREWRRKETTPPDMFRLLGSAGLLGFMHRGDLIEPIPWVQNIYLYRELAMASGGVAIASLAHSQLGLQALYLYGEGRKHEATLEAGLHGEAILAFANTEPSAGSDASAIRTTARRDADEYIVNGMKSYITNGDIADKLVITAVTDGGVEGKHHGISMFVVDGNADGLVRKRLPKQAWKESHLSTLRFEDVRIPDDAVVGRQGHGFYQTMDIFNRSRIAVASVAYGTALGAFLEAWKFSASRRAFGKALIEHQSKRNEFADHLVDLEAGWLMIRKCADLCDSGSEFKHHASMAKLFATEMAREITSWASVIHGARGVLAYSKVNEYLEDARGALIGEGAPEVQKKIIAENIDDILSGLR